MRTYTIRYQTASAEGLMSLSARDEQDARSRAIAALKLSSPRLDVASVSLEVEEYVRGVA